MPDSTLTIIVSASERDRAGADAPSEAPDLRYLRPGRPVPYAVGAAGRTTARSCGADSVIDSEMASEWPGFRLDESLETGHLPLVVDSTDPEDPEDVLAAYATLYLEQEVKAEGLVRKVGQFARFLEAVSFSHGTVLNVSDVARKCQAKRGTVDGFLEVLEDLLLAYRVPVFTRRAKRKTAAHPRLYLFDTGVFRSLRPSGPLDRPEEIHGAALEGLITQHLRAWIAYTGGDFELFTWQARGGSEVAFVVYGPDGFWAIEVQNVADVRPADLRALRAFAADDPECRTLLLYRGRDRLETSGIPCVPVGEFLRELRPGREILPV